MHLDKWWELCYKTDVYQERRKHFIIGVEFLNIVHIIKNILLYSILINFYCKTKQRIDHTFSHNLCPYKILKQHNEWEWNSLPSLHTACTTLVWCTLFRSQQSVFSFKNEKMENDICRFLFHLWNKFVESHPYLFPKNLLATSVRCIPTVALPPQGHLDMLSRLTTRPHYCFSNM